MWYYTNHNNYHFTKLFFGLLKGATPGFRAKYRLIGEKCNLPFIKIAMLSIQWHFLFNLFTLFFYYKKKKKISNVWCLRKNLLRPIYGVGVIRCLLVMCMFPTGTNFKKLWFLFNLFTSSNFFIYSIYYYYF